MATTQARDLYWLKARIAGTPALGKLAARIEMIASLLQRECADSVVWAVAHGSLIEKLESGQTTRYSGTNLRILVVTRLSSPYEAYMLLGEKVFGPVLTEHGKLVEFDVWTQEQLLRASQSGGAAWDQLCGGIWLFGSPEPPYDRA